MSGESKYISTIDLLSHGFAAIQRSNMFHPELLLSRLRFLRGITDLAALEFGLALSVDFWKQAKFIESHVFW